MAVWLHSVVFLKDSGLQQSCRQSFQAPQPRPVERVLGLGRPQVSFPCREHCGSISAHPSPSHTPRERARPQPEGTLPMGSVGKERVWGLLPSVRT